MTAVAAQRANDTERAARAWVEFHEGTASDATERDGRAEQIRRPAVLNFVNEAAWISNQSTERWGRAAMPFLVLGGAQTAG